MMKSRLRRRYSSGNADESVNPMDGVANLADVMLILAVGIMMALVIHWNVDIGMVAYLPDELPYTNADNAIILDGGMLDDAADYTEQIDSGEMERLGTVFYDETTGKFYIVVE